MKRRLGGIQYVKVAINETLLKFASKEFESPFIGKTREH